jgi:pimeloyl-ACP methyl ester carboxylesterase
MSIFPPELADWCAGDGEFRLLARHWTGRLVLHCEEERFGLQLADGEPSPSQGPDATANEPGQLSVSAPAEVWRRLLEEIPPPYLNDVMPAQAFGLTFGGHRETQWQYYPALRRLIELLRFRGQETPDPGPPRDADRLSPARFDAPTGRYVHLLLDGHDHRVYFEEAGTGIPLVLQHTAGSHGVQWRHLFEDPWVTDRFHLVAYDLPFHGKSLPASTRRWWAERYELTTAFAMSVPVALVEALALERPVYMGSSIGGCLALDLARFHPECFRAVIALEPALNVDDLDADSLSGFWHPRVSNEYKAHLMHGLMAPTSPEPFRRETVFAYSQGWPPAFSGDLHYYLVDHDLREEATRIDTTKVGVHLLTGEYDYSATIAHGTAAHEAIAGSTFTVMSGLGHFPMSEDPDRFMTYLRPVLEGILDG